MIVLAFDVEPGHGRGPLMLVLILEKENMDRMREGDPFDIHLGKTRDYPKGRLTSELDIVIAYEEDTDTLMRFQREDDIAGLMMWLERGRMHEPGDMAQPVPLRKN